MSSSLKIPKFASEAEEAAWWPGQEDAIAVDFEEAARNGTLLRGSLARRMNGIPPAAVYLEPSDEKEARLQAESKGLKYEEYLAQLLHAALHAEKISSSR